MTTLSVTFARPANVTPYAAGQLLANNTVAGNVQPLAFQLPPFTGLWGLSRARLLKSGLAIANAAFKLHLWQGVAPVPVNGDGGLFQANGAANYLGAFSFGSPILTGGGANPFSDGTRFDAVPDTGTLMLAFGTSVNNGSSLFGLLEARAAYTPGNAEAFTASLELAQMG